MTTQDNVIPVQTTNEPQSEGAAPFAPSTKLLSRFAAQPMYEQLAAVIEQTILNGQLCAGDCIGTEKYLCTTFGVSRITVRQAIDILVEKNVLVRRQGKGTYVARPRIRHNIETLNRLLDTHRIQNSTSSSLLLDFGGRNAPDHIEALFSDVASAPVSLTRLILLDSTPISVSTAWLHPNAKQLTEEQAKEHSTAALLTAELGLVIAKTEYSIRVGNPDRETARLLKVRDNTTIISLARRRYLPDGSLAEYLTSALLPEYYELSFTSEDEFADQPVSRHFLH